jgi:hypothetical protein
LIATSMAMRVRLCPIVVGALLLACSSDSKPRAGDGANGDDTKGGASRAVTGMGDAALLNGQPSLAALGKGIVAALQAKNGRALAALAVTQAEFEQRLFGTVVSDPEARRGGPSHAWRGLSSESVADMAKALSKHGGKGYVFVSLESTKHEARGELVVHEAPRLTVEDANGAPLELKILGQVVEHPASGTFLVLTFAD